MTASFLFVLIISKHSREVIYRGMKGNVTDYELKPFHAEYEHPNDE